MCSARPTLKSRDWPGRANVALASRMQSPWLALPVCAERLGGQLDEQGDRAGLRQACLLSCQPIADPRP